MLASIDTLTAMSSDGAAPPQRRTARIGWFGQLLVFIASLILIVTIAGLAWFLVFRDSFVGFVSALVPSITFSTVVNQTQVVEAVERIEEVALLSLNVRDLVDESDSVSLGLPWGEWVVPGTERSLLVEYSYASKLGVDGSRVQLEASDEHDYLIRVPEFIFIGQSNVDIKVLVDSNGIISFATPAIDKLAMAETVLGDDNKRKIIQQHDSDLRLQAQEFYTGLVLSIDPEANLEFQFAN